MGEEKYQRAVPKHYTLPAWLTWLDQIANWQALLIILVIGLATFSSGLNNPFRGDDDLQIVQNQTVHSITNIGKFFTGSTFYSFDTQHPLTGQYYRPLMTTVYSFLYTVFGPNPFYFHLLQILLMAGAVFFLFMVLSFSVQRSLALLLAIIYFIHPITSQIIFAIPSMQDALMQFFGLAAIWTLIRYKSTVSLIGTIVLLCLAILSKEAGIVYVLIALLFVSLFDRKRLKLLAVSVFSVLLLYALIRNIAVGGTEKVNIGPISEAGLGTRLITIPSIVALYLGKLIWPAHLSSTYNWAVTSLSLTNFFLPLLAILVTLSAAIFAGRLLRQRASKIVFATYCFYAAWFIVSLVVYLQLKPLDMTATEPWFGIPLVGLIGGLGVMAQYLSDASYKNKILIVSVLLFALVPTLVLRTYVRGHDWSSVQRLAQQDIRTSNNNYIAHNDLAVYFYDARQFSMARVQSQKSVSLFSTAVNNDTLGRSCMALKDYPCAYNAFTDGLQHFEYAPTLINKSVLTAYYGNPETNRTYLLEVTKKLPGQPYPWFYLALTDYTKLGLTDEAKSAIQNAYSLSRDPYIVTAYNTIMSGGKLNIVFN